MNTHCCKVWKCRSPWPLTSHPYNVDMERFIGFACFAQAPATLPSKIGANGYYKCTYFVFEYWILSTKNNANNVHQQRNVESRETERRGLTGKKLTIRQIYARAAWQERSSASSQVNPTYCFNMIRQKNNCLTSIFGATWSWRVR